jgi:hypothetical protein
MGVSIATEFDVGSTNPIDSRMIWTGAPSSLNLVPNRYVGLVAFVSGDKDLYLNRGGSLAPLLAWEKVVTTNVDTPTEITSSVNLDLTHNGLVLRVNSPTGINVNLPSSATSMQSGYNVTFVQMGAGNITFNSSAAFNIRNRLGFNKTAGLYSVASILRAGGTSDVLLYGDLV